MSGTRPQEDFLIACKQINAKYATAALREVLKYEATNKTNETPSLKAYIAEFTNYLRRTKPIQSGLSAYAAELGVATTKPGNQQLKDRKLTPCVCGEEHK
jgi:hypothetical protein